jgi:UDP-GlcNAc:undecaprenyl-phosphate GlcNAc-1-phosphate transferase
VRLRASIFRADRLHMHHRLLESRRSTRATVLQLYLLTACFGLIALSFTQLRGTVAVACLAAVALLTVRMVWNLGALSFRPDAPAGPVPGRHPKDER